MTRPATVFGGLLVALLPLAFWLGLPQLSPRHLAGGAAALAGLLLVLYRGRGGNGSLGWQLPAALAALALLVAWSGDGEWLRYYPLLVNLSLLAVFGASLWRGPPVIERLARLGESDLPPRAIAYTRRVTWVWCGFFLANGAVAAYTARFCSLETWTLYNGAIAYALMGLLFAAEWLVRRRIRASRHA